MKRNALLLYKSGSSSQSKYFPGTGSVVDELQEGK